MFSYTHHNTSYCLYRYCVKTYTGHREWVRSIKVSPDGESLSLSSHTSLSLSLSFSQALSWPAAPMIRYKLHPIPPLLPFSIPPQTIRVWMASTKECKAELRGHEHVVECIAWAPDVALPHIAETCGIEVGVVHSTIFIV